MEQKRIYKPYFDVNEYIGKRNNYLTVIGLAERKPDDTSWRLRCRCDCGGTIDVLPYQFKNGAVKSCGCLRNTIYTKQDGRSKHPLYGIWRQMMQRCYNEKSKIYRRYGGRGIYVCEEWHDFSSLLSGLILLAVGRRVIRWTEGIMTAPIVLRTAAGQR